MIFFVAAVSVSVPASLEEASLTVVVSLDFVSAGVDSLLAVFHYDKAPSQAESYTT